jgi:hypothetical protein
MFFVSQVFVLFVASFQVASAADSRERQEVDRSSRASGFGRSAVKLIDRGVRKGAGPTADALISASSRVDIKSAGAKRTNTSDGVRLEEGTWYLQVKGDGSVAEYYNSAPKSGIPVEARLSDATLTQSAVSFAVTNLGAALGLVPGDLMPLNVRHQTRTYGSRSSSVPLGRELLSSEVTFARKIDGLPVLGPGSKIRVELSAAGDVVGYSYNWSALSVSARSQKVHMPNKVLQRAADVAGIGNGSASQVKRFECGYYDAGALEGSAQIQSACLVQTSSRDAAGLVTDQAFVPAAIDVQPDKSWPFAQTLTGQTVVVQEPPTSPQQEK